MGAWTLAALAGLPVLGNLIGGVVAELMETRRWVVGAALHGAAGIAIAVVSVELTPRVLAWASPAGMALGFVAGAMFSVVLAKCARWTRGWTAVPGGRAWLVYLAVAADLFGDGLMTGMGAAVSPALGLILALSQVVANVPGGFATVAHLRDKGVRRRLRLLTLIGLAVPVLVGALLGHVALRDASIAWRGGALAFVAGLLLLATVEDVVPQGDEARPKRWISTAAFAGGFALFAAAAMVLERG